MSFISPVQTTKTVSPKMQEARVESLKNQLQSDGPKSDKKIKDLAMQFESIFIHQMIKEMRKSVPKSDLLNSFSLEMYESMMDEEIAKEMSKQKGIGLGDVIYRQLSRMNDPDAESDSVPRKISLTGNTSPTTVGGN
jgi:flagellar protein FlgJ